MRSSGEVETAEWLGDVARSERRALVGIARSEGLSAEEAVEAVQDGLSTMLCRSRDASRIERERARATLFTIVRNAARNLRRRHHRVKRHVAVSDDELVVRDEAPPADDVIVREESLVRLRTCVAELCGRERAVVTLRLLEERSGEDVARELGLTRGHVDVLVHRAKSSLRACILRAP